MAEINTDGSGGKKKGKKVKPKKMSTRVDLTPMVDLGFLLITFFMLTTTLSKPQTMEINMPVKEKDADSTKVKESLAMTIILSEKNRVFYYFGITDPKVEVTNFSSGGIRKVLLDRNRDAILKINDLKKKLEAKLIKEEEYKKKVSEVKADKNGLIVLIKADDKSKYKNLVDILDEMQITNIGRYAIVDITPSELDLIKNL
jgi:biopolymer transport protein ExbD